MTKDEAVELALKVIGLSEVPYPEKRRGRRGVSDDAIVAAVRNGATTLDSLAEQVGLTKPAVSVRAKALAQQGRLTCTTQQTGKRGRPSVRYAIPAEGQ